MTTDREFDTLLQFWFDESAGAAPSDQVLTAVLSQTARIRPRPAWLARLVGEPMADDGRAGMHRMVPVALVATALVVAALVGIGILTRPSNVGPPSVPVQTPRPSAAAAPTVPPTPAESARPIEKPDWDPYETDAWDTYVSDRYGFTIGHPPSWAEMPAERSWTLEDDAEGADDDWLSPGADAFFGDNVRVSAWSVPVDPQTTPETTAAVETWVQDYCERVSGTACEGIFDRAVPLCVEVRDCHPGLLVPFESEVMAFMTGGIFHDRMTVVAVWWGESEPATTPFGGSQALLEAFLSTMDVWTEEVRDAEIERRDADNPQVSPP